MENVIVRNTVKSSGRIDNDLGDLDRQTQCQHVPIIENEFLL